MQSQTPVSAGLSTLKMGTCETDTECTSAVSNAIAQVVPAVTNKVIISSCARRLTQKCRAARCCLLLSPRSSRGKRTRQQITQKAQLDEAPGGGDGDLPLELQLQEERRT